MTLIPAFYAIFLQPLAGPLVALGLLLAAGYARQRRNAAGLVVALLLLVPTFLLAQCLLSVADWCTKPLPTPAPLYAPGMPNSC